MKLFITYDLKPGNEYPRLMAALRATGACQPLQAGWVVDVQFTASQLRDHLRKFIDEGDRLPVLSLAGSWASIGLTVEDARLPAPQRLQLSARAQPAPTRRSTSSGSTGTSRVRISRP